MAMILDESPESLIGKLGHDGSEIIVEGVPDPQGRRGFHLQEFIPIIMAKGFSLTPYEYAPVSLICGQQHKLTIFENYKRFKDIRGKIRHGRGILTGECGRTAHAVAFNKGVIRDPDGREYAYSIYGCIERGFAPQCLWLLGR